MGADVLPEEKEALKDSLDPDEEKKLTDDLLEIYDRLLPSAESDDRRRQFVRKLEKLLNEQWPGHDIKVHVFGSSGNKLCSSDSDVDICITTTYKELEHVCLLAEFLAQHGMERVVCVSHAKVPIVKIWDPELRLACDMNVNNTLALENTRMVRTYVEIDERVRPLAMVVKYWTKRRILNDAALGGTLSSYTWICLIINFLQTRYPPILPSLQARPHKKRVTSDGLVCSFDDDLKSLVGYGRTNTQSLGELFFEFFRYYGHEVDFEKNVISVREGKLISKEAKGWHLLQNNRLCVEEPFNTSRNLGNTADDTSFRGVHLELRRAFKLLSEDKLDDCCEPYKFPPEEERIWERPTPAPRPVLSVIPMQPSFRGGRGGGAGGRGGGRYSNYYGRSANSQNGRRTSNGANKSNNYRHSTAGLNSPDLAMQAQQVQYFLHDHLYQQIQILQAQEQELRLQLHNQALLTGRPPPPVLIRQPFIQFPFPQQESSSDENSRNGAGVVNSPPATAPPRHHFFYNPAYLPVTASGIQGSSTNPPSPSTSTAVPDLRRNPRRSSVANGSPAGSLRAQSQPARPPHSALPHSWPPLFSVSQTTENSPTSKQSIAADSPDVPHGEDENSHFISSSVPTVPRPGYFEEPKSSEYVNYYLGAAPHMLAHHSMISPFSAPVGLAVQNGFLCMATSSQDHRSPAFSQPELPLSPTDQHSFDCKSVSSQQHQNPRSAPSRDSGPLIVDGSVASHESRHSIHVDHFDPYTLMSQCTSTSDDNVLDTPASVSDSLSQDLPDNNSLDLEHQSFFSGQSSELRKSDHSSETKMGSSVAQPQLLSSQLQSLHLPGSEHEAEPSHKTGAEISRTGCRPAEKSERQTNCEKIAALSFEEVEGSASLSLVSESLTPSPSSKRRPNGVDLEKVNGISHWSDPKGRPEAYNATTHASFPEIKDRHLELALRKTNAYPSIAANRDPSTLTTNGGWQTTKKKHRRGAKSSVEWRHVPQSSVEPFSADEFLRKGG